MVVQIKKRKQSNLLEKEMIVSQEEINKKIKKS